MGPPSSGKKEIAEKLVERKIKGRTYPFIGRFWTSNMSIKNKDFNLVCFYTMKDHSTLKKDNIILLDKKPKIIVFVANIYSDYHKIESQGNIFREVKRFFPKTPTIVVMNKYVKSREKMNHIKRIFGSSLLTVPVDRKKGIVKLRNAMKNKVIG
ncbi:hypothetical protein ACFLQN_00625 [Candidatus Aenigmatarchaeota archaeon]